MKTYKFYNASDIFWISRVSHFLDLETDQCFEVLRKSKNCIIIGNLARSRYLITDPNHTRKKCEEECGEFWNCSYRITAGISKTDIKEYISLDKNMYQSKISSYFLKYGFTVKLSYLESIKSKYGDAFECPIIKITKAKAINHE